MRGEAEIRAELERQKAARLNMEPPCGLLDVIWSLATIEALMWALVEREKISGDIKVKKVDPPLPPDMPESKARKISRWIVNKIKRARK